MQTHNNILMHNNNINHNNINITTTTKDNNNKKKKNITSPSLNAQACAACKHRRRKCTPDCILAPYFAHDHPRRFLNAHHLFGVSNIVKIVRHLTPPERDLAMWTIVFEYDARAADPAGGCHRIIRDLEHRISLARAELKIVLHHLAVCRAAAAAQHSPPLEEKWREPCAAEDDVDSWGCANENFRAHAESTSSSFHDHHHGRGLSYDEMMRPILDHLVCDDDDDDLREEGFKFDCHANIITPCSNNGSLTERDTFKEDDDDDECLSYIQDHQDLKAAAAFIGLTN